MDDEKIAGVKIKNLCEICFHENICKFKDNHSNICKKLINTSFNKDPNGEFVIIDTKCDWFINRNDLLA